MRELYTQEILKNKQILPKKTNFDLISQHRLDIIQNLIIKLSLTYLEL